MTGPKANTVDEYITSFPSEVRTLLDQIRMTFKTAIPGAEETISYSIPTYRLNNTYIIYFAGYKTHIGIYPIPNGDELFQEEIARFKKGKGTLQFPLNKPIPFDLIAKVVAFAMMENAERSRQK